MIAAGIDAGSRTIKVVLMDGQRQQVLGQDVADQGVRQDALAGEVYDRVLARCRLARRDVARAIGTGYARGALSMVDQTITEITCHAAGVRHQCPEVRTVIEIGGQDSKLIRLTPQGRVHDFAMNDRCAAGTGRFLEVVAARLDTALEKLGDLASRSGAPAGISSMCVVFAETEIIGLLAGGAASEDIVAGVQASIASRVAAMAGRRLVAPIVFTGGVAMVGGMAAALGAAFGQPVTVSPQPVFTGALGAALLACRRPDNGGLA
ncbi:MAG: acyl-CoA dehydratase activase [Phycisphaerae bacterium]|nr:acyl-CoA dehydratase activase [Phycisphaerae bacterium]